MTKTPALLAAAFFALLALFIARLAVAPLGPADLLGIAACACAAGAAAAFPFALDYARASAPPPSPAAQAAGPSPEALAAALAPHLSAPLANAVAAAVTASLTQAESDRRAEILRAVAETPARAIDTDDLSAPSGKTRLGRGLAGLIQGTSLKASPAPESSPADDSRPTT